MIEPEAEVGMADGIALGLAYVFLLFAGAILWILVMIERARE